MVLREGRQAILAFIDYSAAFDTESQIFLDCALMDAGVSAKVRRIVRAIFTAATGLVRLRQPGGGDVISQPFNIERGVLQGDILSLVSFIAGLDRVFRLHDAVNAGVVVGGCSSMSTRMMRHSSTRPVCKPLPESRHLRGDPWRMRLCSYMRRRARQCTFTGRCE